MTISPPPCRLVEHADLGGVESDLEEVEVVLRVDAVALRDVGHDEPVVPELQLGLLLRREDGRAHSQVLNVGAHVGKETARAWVMFSDELGTSHNCSCGQAVRSGNANSYLTSPTGEQESLILAMF